VLPEKEAENISTSCDDNNMPIPVLSVSTNVGKNEFILNWNKVEPSGTGGVSFEEYRIYRCEGVDTDCKDIQNFKANKHLINTITNSDTITYKDTNVKWKDSQNLNYYYAIAGVYSGKEVISNIISKPKNDKACEGRGNEPFCDSNTRYTCVQNQKTETSCSSGVCVTINNVAECKSLIQNNCEEIGKPFGLFYKANEITYGALDKSKTVVDNCYHCNGISKCTDYKTQSACEGSDGNKCSVGRCAWKPFADSSGFDNGVCVDINKDNCDECSIKDTKEDKINGIFDTCTPERARALSVTKNNKKDTPTNLAEQCQYLKPSNEESAYSKLCNDITCYDLNAGQCKDTADTGLISLCGLTNCAFDGICIRDSTNDDIPNSDCDLSNGIQYCRDGKTPPKTIITLPPEITKGTGEIQFSYDNLNDASPRDIRTFFCIDQTNQCIPYNSQQDYCSASYSSNSKSLKLNGINSNADGIISGKGCSRQVKQGTNYLRYASIDKSGNLEQTKSISFTAKVISVPKLIFTRLSSEDKIDLSNGVKTDVGLSISNDQNIPISCIIKGNIPPDDEITNKLKRVKDETGKDVNEIIAPQTSTIGCYALSHKISYKQLSDGDYQLQSSDGKLRCFYGDNIEVFTDKTRFSVNSN
ncbi:MAG: hypothetical protein AABY14_00840, partial [Nanoarchaeota archaeon]